MSLRRSILLLAALLPITLGVAFGPWLVADGSGPPAEPGSPRLKLTVVFDNVSLDEKLECGWGFACLVEGLERTVLFDTGSDGEILLANMKKLEIDPGDVDVVVLSHVHLDHTGGLQAFLKKNSRVDVMVTKSFPHSLREEIARTGARVIASDEPRELFDGLHTTGALGEQFIEQSLILDTRDGLAVVTGCAHPVVLNIVRRAKQQVGREVHFAAGGFHLDDMSNEQLEAILRSLKEEGLRRVAPSHCTGDKAKAMFREIWKDGYVEGGCGAVIELPR